MKFIDVRCQFCNKLLCQVSSDFSGLVRVKCRHHKCRKENIVSLAVILKQSPDNLRYNPSACRTSAQ